MTYGADAFGSAPFGATGAAAGGGGGAPPGATVVTTLRVTVAPAPAYSVPLRVRVVAPTVHAPVPLRVQVSPVGAAVLKWRPVVVLDGVDVSARVTGVVEIEAEESSARIAAFSLLPQPGQVQPAAWVGRPVSISVADAAGTGVWRRFTGVVDVPHYDVNTGVVTYECTDQRQEVIANAPRAWVDAQIGGWWSEPVFGAALDTLAYAEARLQTVPKALSLDAWQRPRVTSWLVAGTPYANFDAGDVLDGSLSVSLASRADLRNVVETEAQYRFPRLRARTIVTDWRLAGDYRAKGNLPTRAMIEQAITGLPGWQLRGKIRYTAPPVGSQSFNGGIYNMPADVALQLAIGFTARHEARWSQTVTERVRVEVRNQASIDAVGEARDTRSGATLQVDYDAALWVGDMSAKPYLSRLTPGDMSADVGGAGTTDRAAFDNAVATLAARGGVAVQAAHRGNRVSFDLALRPDLDIGQTLHVDATLADGRRVVARAVVGALAEVLDADTGGATSRVTLYASGLASVGVQPYDPPVAPAQPDDPTPASAQNAYTLKCGTYVGRVNPSVSFSEDAMVGFITNLIADDVFGAYNLSGELFPVQFSVEAPEIEAGARDPLELETLAQYAIDVPQDLLEIYA